MPSFISNKKSYKSSVQTHSYILHVLIWVYVINRYSTVGIMSHPTHYRSFQGWFGA